MKYLYPVILLFLLVTCKRKQEPEPLVPPGEGNVPGEVKKKDFPLGMLAFSIDEVPEENIRFISLQVGTAPIYDRIMVTLPKTYPNGDNMTARIKLADGYIIRDFFLREYDPNALDLNFSKTDVIWLFIYNTKTDTNVADFYMFVDPAIPLVAPSIGKDYEEVLEGRDIYLYLPVQNLGTAKAITENDSLVDRVTILIRNKNTGQTTVSTGAYFLENPNNDLFAQIPVGLVAGEYELTIQKQNRKVVVPDALILKYGKPVVQMWPVTSASKSEQQTVTYDGYNLLPDHEYTMEFKNDFSETLHLKLSPVSPLSLAQDIPASFPSGNYEAALFIDGKEIPSYFVYNRSLFALKKESSQPILTLLSNHNNAVPGEATLYKAITTLKRNEPIIADFRDAVRADMVLLFKNTLTGKEYELPYSGSTTAVVAFPFFNIPEEVPTGKYEVRAREGNRTSERYQRMITLE